ncbi:MAG: class I SAM-dependent methyltransferase [Williamsia sp.]|nr:class I SAM-dependent methyltransferase [Williamsia sp.]
MFEFHQDRKRYFDIQVINAEKWVIPFVEEKFTLNKGIQVLEIGCGEGGVLKAFVNKGCTGVGVEFDKSRIDNANNWLAEDIAAGRIRFVTKDIYKTSPQELGSFDLIVLKDVIEHIHDQQKLINRLQDFLKPAGAIFFGFPPWQMPFGGHQQICRNKLTSKLPYYHLLPRPIYKAILQKYREPVDELLEIKDTGISIERFEKIVRRTGYRMLNRRFYLINPIYEWKFGWKAREQVFPLAHIPFLRNFFTTCVYYLITPRASDL